MQIRRLATLVVAAAVLALGDGMSRAQDTHALTLHSLRDSDLPHREDPFPVWHSRSAEAVADEFVATMADAVAWYRTELGWDGPLGLAVLDSDDYARYAGQPYPVPYAEIASLLVVMPDSIAAFPGFERWGINDRALNTSLTFHEIGHAIANDIGLWSTSFWVDELVANVFLAAYLRATHPDDRSLLGGVPQGFADAARTTDLRTLDDLYSDVGLDNYAWFQFRLAAIADYLVADGDFRRLIAGLRAAFPKDNPTDAVMPTPEEVMRRLEALRPGVTALASDMLVRPLLPAATVRPCTNAVPPSGPRHYLDIENTRATPLAINIRDIVYLRVTIDNFDVDREDEAFSAEMQRLTDTAMETDAYAIILPPGHRRVFSGEAGAEFKIVGGDCIVMGDEPVRFIAD